MSDHESEQYSLIFIDIEGEWHLILVETELIEYEDYHNEDQSWCPSFQQAVALLRVALILLCCGSLLLLVYPQDNFRGMLCQDGQCQFIYNVSCKNAGFLVHMNLSGVMEDVDKMTARIGNFFNKLQHFYMSKASRKYHISRLICVHCQSHRQALAWKKTLKNFEGMKSHLWQLLCYLARMCMKLMPY